MEGKPEVRLAFRCTNPECAGMNKNGIIGVTIQRGDVTTNGADHFKDLVITFCGERGRGYTGPVVPPQACQIKGYGQAAGFKLMKQGMPGVANGQSMKDAVAEILKDPKNYYVNVFSEEGYQLAAGGQYRACDKGCGVIRGRLSPAEKPYYNFLRDCMTWQNFFANDCARTVAPFLYTIGPWFCSAQWCKNIPGHYWSE